jgi:hypothetical protein
MADHAGAFEAAQRARWMRPDAARWIRPDAARFLKPGTDPRDVYPALAQKYSPDQPRVPAGNPDGGQWTDGGGKNDPRVLSDADPEGIRPYQQYAQNRRGRSGVNVLINGQRVELTPAQGARLAVAQAEARDAVARVRRLESDWKPSPSAYQTAEGLIRSYQADAAQARVRASELAEKGGGPGPFSGEIVHARGPERNFTAEERREINRIGSETGCHTCGVRSPGTISGNWVIDHQLPSALNPTGVRQRLYPHCLSCMRIQGGTVSAIIGRKR